MVSLLSQSLASVSEQSSRYCPVNFCLLIALCSVTAAKTSSRVVHTILDISFDLVRLEEAHLVSDYVQMEAEISQPVRPIGQVANMPETSFLGSCFCGVMSTVYIVGLLYSEWVLIRFHATTAATSAQPSTQIPCVNLRSLSVAK